ncbi:MAG TPA: ATP-dependent DNA helicase UvrD2, partial [Candidatus Limnocylindrales bacterium]|nr:ATP-dependent DNA helicase UvrD2 [Candidatus Limnocylindrales bacterium]
LLVTFTDRAATEMVDRMASLGHLGVMAKTFHAMALAQLRHFWPSRHEGAPLPAIADGKGRLLYPLAGRLPGGYKFTQVKDLAETIEWAKVRRIRPERWVAEGGDRAPIPADLFARLYTDYERAKARAGVIDFEDMLVETVDLLETDEEALALVTARKTWFSVDEYQDTNPLAERLVHLWLGESRDLAVVGDPDQTIYSFTGATPEYLLGFERVHPGARVVALVENYRSTPQVLELANRLTGKGLRGALLSTRPAGPVPTIRRFADDEAERDALVTGIRELLRAGIEPGEIAVLVRINAQLPEFEQPLARSGIPFAIRGQRFFDRREIRDARRLLRTAKLTAVGAPLIVGVRRLFEERLGLGGDGEGRGDEAAERSASLETLVSIVAEVATARPEVTLPEVIAELDGRDTDEATGASGGVNLLTYHRAKGLEWDAVFLPALEEGLVPIRQAKEDAEVDEERRLLYVGMTRARTHLALSWSQSRIGAGGKAGRRQRSRFLISLERGRTTERRVVTLPPAGRAGVASPEPEDRPLLEALQLWRRDRARADAMPAYVVAHDATLRAIAEDRPRTLAALRRVKGMGPAKLESYGEEILALIEAKGAGGPAASAVEEASPHGAREIR